MLFPDSVLLGARLIWSLDDSRWIVLVYYCMYLICIWLKNFFNSAYQRERGRESERERRVDTVDF